MEPFFFDILFHPLTVLITIVIIFFLLFRIHNFKTALYRERRSVWSLYTQAFSLTARKGLYIGDSINPYTGRDFSLSSDYQNLFRRYLELHQLQKSMETHNKERKERGDWIEYEMSIPWIWASEGEKRQKSTCEGDTVVHAYHPDLGSYYLDTYFFYSFFEPYDGYVDKVGLNLEKKYEVAINAGVIKDISSIEVYGASRLREPIFAIWLIGALNCAHDTIEIPEGCNLYLVEKSGSELHVVPGDIFERLFTPKPAPEWNSAMRSDKEKALNEALGYLINPRRGGRNIAFPTAMTYR